MASGGHDPAKLLRWIIKETAKPNYTTTGQPSNNNNDNKNNDNDNDNNTNNTIPVTKLADLTPQEQQKWRNIILGQTPDMLNNRQSLQQAIKRLSLIQNNIKDKSANTNDIKTNDNDARSALKIDSPCSVYSDSLQKWFFGKIIKITNDNEGEWLHIEYDIDNNKKVKQVQRLSKYLKPGNVFNADNNGLGDNDEIINCLEIIHHLIDKNEAVLAKLNVIKLLLNMINNSMNKDNEICLLCCTILHDSTQNNPMMQNHIYDQNGIQILTETLKNTSKFKYKIRSKLWALIHVICRDHNPNFNLFLSNYGYHQIIRILRIEQNNINDELLREILRVSRLLNYMLSVWSDGNDIVFNKLNILQSINWSIYSLHSYLIALVSVNNQNPKSPKLQQKLKPLNRVKTSQLILDILMELIGGIRMFMKRDDKCKKFIIANKNNKDITLKLKQLQNDLAAYCTQHRPNIKINEIKHKKSYRYCYYKNKNDNHDNDQKDQKDNKDNDDDNDDADDQYNHSDQLFLAMKDICNTIGSILRHVNRYEANRLKQIKMQEMWFKSLPKHKQKQYLNKKNKSKLNNNNNKPSLSSSPPPSINLESQYQIVLYNNKNNKNDNNDNNKKKKKQFKDKKKKQKQFKHKNKKKKHKNK